MTNEISNSDDIIDSRDVIERIAELESLGMLSAEGEDDEFNIRLLDDDEREEYESLKALAAQGEGYAPDWQYGETLIRDSYFTDYARELLVDIGTIPEDLPEWVVIDWEETADTVQQDYTSVEFDGVTYWVR